MSVKSRVMGALVVALALGACGGGTTGGNNNVSTGDLASAASGDLATPSDMAMSMPGDAPPAECMSPKDCGGNPCCLTVTLQVNQGVVCTKAATDCQPALDLSGSGMTRLCTVDADCTTGVAKVLLGSCCAATKNGATTHMCFNKSLASFSMGAVVCP